MARRVKIVANLIEHLWQRFAQLADIKENSIILWLPRHIAMPSVWCG